MGPLLDPVTTRSDKRACGKPLLTDHDKQATENREPANEMNEEDPTKGIPVWLQPFTVYSEDLERCVRTFPLKEWTQIRSARCPKPHGKREISDMNEDLGNHSKDQLYYLTHWLDISQNSEKNKANSHQFGKKLFIITRNFIGYALFAGGIWEKKILITDIEELEKRWSIKKGISAPKYISKDRMRKKSWEPKKMENLYFLWQMA